LRCRSSGCGRSKTLRQLRTAPPARGALAIFALGLAAHALLLLCYFWGKFDDPVILRAQPAAEPHAGHRDRHGRG